MSQPPNPSVIWSQLNQPKALKAFTATEAGHYNSPTTMQVEYGIGDDTYEGMRQIMGGDDPFKAIPESHTRRDFYESIMVHDDDSYVFNVPDDRPGELDASPGYRYSNLADEPQSFTGPGGESGAPAPITEVPTSSINPEWPRTVAAGYDRNRQCLTVVFRDGTYYNYYGVTAGQWSNFQRARSKGRFIKTYLDALPRGAADITQIPTDHRDAMYQAARTGQIQREGVTGKQSPNSKRGGRGSYKPGNLGGTGRARIKRLGQ